MHALQEIFRIGNEIFIIVLEKGGLEENETR